MQEVPVPREQVEHVQKPFPLIHVDDIAVPHEQVLRVEKPYSVVRKEEVEFPYVKVQRVEKPFPVNRVEEVAGRNPSTCGTDQACREESSAYPSARSLSAP